MHVVCLIRLLVYRRIEFHNHTVLSCTCASPSSFVIDFALSRERIEEGGRWKIFFPSQRSALSILSRVNDQEQDERIYKEEKINEDEAYNIGDTHVHHGESQSSEWRACNGLPLCAHGDGCDTEWHADAHGCGRGCDVLFRKACPHCRTHVDSGLHETL